MSENAQKCPSFVEMEEEQGKLEGLCYNDIKLAHLHSPPSPQKIGHMQILFKKIRLTNAQT